MFGLQSLTGIQQSPGDQSVRPATSSAATARPSPPIRSTTNLAQGIPSGPISRTIRMGEDGGSKEGNKVTCVARNTHGPSRSTRKISCL